MSDIPRALTAHVGDLQLAAHEIAYKAVRCVEPCWRCERMYLLVYTECTDVYDNGTVIRYHAAARCTSDILLGDSVHEMGVPVCSRST